MCKEDSSVFVDDAAIVQIFNCTAYDKIENKSLRAFLKFVQTNTAESDFTRRLDDMVETQKKVEELKKNIFHGVYMTATCPAKVEKKVMNKPSLKRRGI